MVAGSFFHVWLEQHWNTANNTHKHNNFVLYVNASEKSKPRHFMPCLPHKTVYIIYQDTTECAHSTEEMCERKRKKKRAQPIQLEKLFKWRKLLRETKFLIATNYGTVIS